MRQMRKDMEQEGTQFEVVDNAVLPGDLNAGFVRQLVQAWSRLARVNGTPPGTSRIMGLPV